MFVDEKKEQNKRAAGGPEKNVILRYSEGLSGI